MRKDKKIVLGIVTKDRQRLLHECLVSIVRQSIVPDLVFVIDNSKTRSAKKIVDAFRSKLKIKYLNKSEISVPECRQIIFSQNSTLIGFIDDDCEVETEWVESALTEAGKSKASFFAGPIKISNPNNLVALAQFTRDDYWLIRKIRHGNKIYPNLLDTKNLVLIKKYIPKKFSFSLNVQEKAYDSGDLDLAAQFWKGNLFGWYVDKMVCYHYETEKISRYITRAIARGKMGRKVEVKWGINLDLYKQVNTKAAVFLITLLSLPRDSFRYYNSQRLIFTNICIIFLIKLYDFCYGWGYVEYEQSNSEKIN